MRLATAVVASILLAPVAAAQTAGSWGAEASSGPSASLLRFRDTTSAWVVSASGSLQRVRFADDSVGAVSNQQTILSEVRVGLRRYGSSDAQLRSYSTWSGIVTYEENPVQRGWGVGAAAEMGGARFFSPRVSLGVSADVSVTYRMLERESFSPIVGSPATQDFTVVTARFSGFRLVAGVYF